jgi:hypothetical protein
VLRRTVEGVIALMYRGRRTELTHILNATTFAEIQTLQSERQHGEKSLAHCGRSTASIEIIEVVLPWSRTSKGMSSALY